MGYIVYHAYNGVCNFYKNGKMEVLMQIGSNNHCKTTNVQYHAQVFKRIGEALKVALELNMHNETEKLWAVSPTLLKTIVK